MSANVVKLFIETLEKTYTQVVKIPDKFPYVIGRQTTDLSIKDQRISRRHCQLVIDKGMLFVEDLGSRHGVEVNGSKIKRIGLRLDDLITIGSTRIKVVQIALAKKTVKKTTSF